MLNYFIFQKNPKNYFDTITNNRIFISTKVNNYMITHPLPLPKRCIKLFGIKSIQPPTLQEILADVCDVFGESIINVISKRRRKEYIKCRMVYCYVANVLTEHTYKEIGAVVNYGDHTTYYNQLDTALNMFLSNDELFMEQWDKYVQNSRVWRRYFPVLTQLINKSIRGIA